MFKVAFKKFDRDKHYFTDPFPHIFIENALNSLQVQSIVNKHHNFEKWRQYPSEFRIDYLFPAGDHTIMYNALCDIFGLEKFKKDKVFSAKGELFNHVDTKNPDNNKSVCSHSVFSVYNQDVITVPENLSKLGATRPHIDRELKIIVCLLYCADPDDDLGGDLYLYEKQGDEFVTRKIIPYKPGNFIIFPNTVKSYHGVGPRQVGQFSRKMACLTFDTYDKEWVSTIKPRSSELRRTYGTYDY